VDTLECGRFHGDMLPPGISDDQITEVRRLLARDYALTFQVSQICISKSCISIHLKTDLYSFQQITDLVSLHICSQSLKCFLFFCYVCGSSVQDREILQLAVGRLVRELVDAMSECGTIPTFFLYSGHDATIMPLSGTSFSVLLLMKSLSW
jgi:hypothetical protein